MRARGRFADWRIPDRKPREGGEGGQALDEAGQRARGGVKIVHGDTGQPRCVREDALERVPLPNSGGGAERERDVAGEEVEAPRARVRALS